MLGYLITSDYSYSRVMVEPYLSAKHANVVPDDGTIIYSNRLLELRCHQVSPTSGLYTRYWGSLNGKHFYSQTLIDLNPPLEIETIQHQGKHFHIVRDDKLVAGTKQRMVTYMLDALGLDSKAGIKLIYAGPPSGVAQVALSLLGAWHGIEVTYVTKTITDMTLKAITFGLKVITSWSVTKKYQELIRTGMYVELPLGLKGFEDCLASGIKSACSVSNLSQSTYDLLKTPSKRVWCIIGTGTLETAIRRSLEGSTTIKVQVGYDNDKADYIAPEAYLDHALDMPPYKSVSVYDAKVWQFASKLGQDGDFIWNVASSSKTYLEFYPELEHQARYIYVRELFDPILIRQTLSTSIQTRQTNDFEIKYLDAIKLSHPTSCIEYRYNTDTSDSLFTEYFIEHIRLKVPRADKPSAFESTRHRKFTSLVSKHLRQTSRHCIPDLMRRCLTDIKANHCTTFPYGPAINIYNKFNASRTLDMCAGWGDRMVAAYKSGKVREYVGVDPNSSLAIPYEMMSKCLSELASSQGKEFSSRLIVSAFEDVKLEGEFDLMFSCPPYFITERYSDDPDQSCNRYSDVNGWLEGFMYPSLSKVYSHLKLGGNMVLCLTDTYANKFCQDVFEYAIRIGFDYIGSEAYKYYTGGRYISQPCWMFSKKMK